MTTKITMTKESTITAIGQRRNANRKEVLDLTNGILYASVTDTAEAIGVTEGAISQNLTRTTKTCKGRVFCYAKEANEHLGEISASMKAQQQEINRLQEAEIDSIHAIHRLQDENERLRNENAELQMCVDAAQGNLDWHADVVAKCHEEMSALEAENEALRKELQEYKERQAKLKRVRALRKELAELEYELSH